MHHTNASKCYKNLGHFYWDKSDFGVNCSSLILNEEELTYDGTPFNRGARHNSLWVRECLGKFATTYTERESLPKKGDIVWLHIGERVCICDHKKGRSCVGAHRRERAKDRALDNRMEDRDKCNKTFLSVAGVRSTKFYFWQNESQHRLGSYPASKEQLKEIEIFVVLLWWWKAFMYISHRNLI